MASLLVHHLAAIIALALILIPYPRRGYFVWGVSEVLTVVRLLPAPSPRFQARSHAFAFRRVLFVYLLSRGGFVYTESLDLWGAVVAATPIVGVMRAIGAEPALLLLPYTRTHSSSPPQLLCVPHTQKLTFHTHPFRPPVLLLLLPIATGALPAPTLSRLLPPPSPPPHRHRRCSCSVSTQCGGTSTSDSAPNSRPLPRQSSHQQRRTPPPALPPYGAPRCQIKVHSLTTCSPRSGQLTVVLLTSSTSASRALSSASACLCPWKPYSPSRAVGLACLPPSACCLLCSPYSTWAVAKPPLRFHSPLSVWRAAHCSRRGVTCSLRHLTLSTLLGCTGHPPTSSHLCSEWV